MVISITGTSKGLGKSIAQYCKSKLHTVVEYDRTYDIRDYSIRKKIINSSNNCDIFFSVAKADFSQTQLLYEWYEKYKDDKCIISIGSQIVDYDFWGMDVHLKRYHTQKLSLQHAVKQLNSDNIILLNPGHLYDNEINYEKLFSWCEKNIEQYV